DHRHPFDCSLSHYSRCGAAPEEHSQARDVRTRNGERAQDHQYQLDFRYSWKLWAVELCGRKSGHRRSNKDAGTRVGALQYPGELRRFRIHRYARDAPERNRREHPPGEHGNRTWHSSRFARNIIESDPDGQARNQPRSRRRPSFPGLAALGLRVGAGARSYRRIVGLSDSIAAAAAFFLIVVLAVSTMPTEPRNV